MPEKTGLEKMEETASVMFGNPTALNGAADKSMLEMTDTNRWVFDSNQSELLLAIDLLHKALISVDNRRPSYRRTLDEQTGKWSSHVVQVDNWAWLDGIVYGVKTNQLTIKAFSRFQHLKQTAAMSNIVEVDEPRSFWARLFGGG